MTLRSRETLKLRAHRLLDEVRAGIPHSPQSVNWALSILGEPLESA